MLMVILSVPSIINKTTLASGRKGYDNGTKIFLLIQYFSAKKTHFWEGEDNVSKIILQPFLPLNNKKLITLKIEKNIFLFDCYIPTSLKLAA